MQEVPITIRRSGQENSVVPDKGQALNLARRIKRLAWADRHNFFIACAPGLEEEGRAELAELGVEAVCAHPGGLDFHARLDTAYKIHLHCRLFNRLWLRLHDFRWRGLPDFQRKLAAVPWEIFVPANASLRPHLETGAYCHSGRLALELEQGAGMRLRRYGLAPVHSSRQGDIRVMLRIRDQRCQISLDLSGKLLHQRGYRLNPGPAPLRETLAAALLRLCAYDGSLPLLDPMSGSGSLALEAAQIALRLPAGGQRDFTLNHLPCHREKTWLYLRAQALREAGNFLPAPIWLRDIASLRPARENACSLDRNFHLDISGQINWREENFFTAPPPPGPGVVVINPPYGVRLGSVRRGERLSRDLARRLGSDYQGWRLGIILYRPEWQRYFNLREARRLTVSHGGLKITMLSGIVA